MRLEFYGANRTTFKEHGAGGSVAIVIQTTEMLLSHITESGSGMSSILTLCVSF